MQGPSEDKRRPSLVLTTVKAVATIGVLSYAASAWLASSRLDQGTLSRLAAATAVGVDDPITTGSVDRSRAATRLDPCVLPRR